MFHTLITQRLVLHPHFNAFNSILVKYETPILMCHILTIDSTLTYEPVKKYTTNKHASTHHSPTCALNIEYGSSILMWHCLNFTFLYLINALSDQLTYFLCAFMRPYSPLSWLISSALTFTKAFVLCYRVFDLTVVNFKVLNMNICQIKGFNKLLCAPWVLNKLNQVIPLTSN